MNFVVTRVSTFHYSFCAGQKQLKLLGREVNTIYSSPLTAAENPIARELSS